MKHRTRIVGLVGLGMWLIAGTTFGAHGRKVISLDGKWDIAEGTMDKMPARFERTVPVPGLVDMAKPPFDRVGMTNQPRQAFWYRKTFRLDGKLPEVAMLKIHKAAYGSRVYVNGRMVGEHLPSFTPGWFDVRDSLKTGGAQHELVVRVGAFRDALPPHIPNGWDFEKKYYTPGLFDSVELIFSGTPHIARVQVAPDIANQLIRVQAVIRNQGPLVTRRLNFTVREAASRKVVATHKSSLTAFVEDDERTVNVIVRIRECRLWSPDDPFLYELETDTGNDVMTVRFGMREFHFEARTGRAYLNGKRYFLRGSNVTLYRFFEDTERGDKPWREEWVRRLHRRFKEMNWHALRYCIGFPPEMWYRIADEEGFLIQDEYPLWHLSGDRLTNTWPAKLTSDQLAKEYTEWMQERWNHPCVVIWDAQNETITPETGKAIQKVRGFDLSNRPWDNGWGEPQAPRDCYESHPYMFNNPNFKLSNVAGMSGLPRGNPTPNKGTNAIVINEYGWLWLNRDGLPTTLTKEAYKNLLGENATVAQRRHLYARYLAAKTEFWRARRVCAGVLHFCGLGYARPDGQTSDHFTDLEKLTFEPEFFDYVRDAFAPVGVMLDHWADELLPGTARDVPVVVINDLYADWNGAVRFRLLRGKEIIEESDQLCRVDALGKKTLKFVCNIPAEPGSYQMETALVPLADASASRPADDRKGAERLLARTPTAPEPKLVRSLRDFEVLTAAQRQARLGLAIGKPVKASSSVTRDGVTHFAAYAVDGKTDTRWSSEFSNPQWLAVDLGTATEISRVELLWEAAFARSYAIQISTDGEQWKDVYTTDKGQGGKEVIQFASTPARWVRFYGTKRATEFGYSLWEMRVFE